MSERLNVRVCLMYLGECGCLSMSCESVKVSAPFSLISTACKPGFGEWKLIFDTGPFIPFARKCW